MDRGKLAAQCGHAARLSLLQFLRDNPHYLSEFLDRNSVGTLVVLEAPNLHHLHELSLTASQHGLPWALFVDSGHILPPHFDGTPIETALAIGPAIQQRIKPLLRAYRCVKGTKS